MCRAVQFSKFKFGGGICDSIKYIMQALFIIYLANKSRHDKNKLPSCHNRFVFVAP